MGRCDAFIHLVNLQPESISESMWKFQWTCLKAVSFLSREECRGEWRREQKEVTTHLNDGCGSGDGNERCRRSYKASRNERDFRLTPPSAPAGGPRQWRGAKGLQHTAETAQQQNLMDLCDCIEIYSLSSQPAGFSIHFSKCFLRAPHQRDKSRGRV